MKTKVVFSWQDDHDGIKRSVYQVHCLPPWNNHDWISQGSFASKLDACHYACELSKGKSVEQTIYEYADGLATFDYCKGAE